MTVYIDSDFKCHLANDGNMTSYENDMFDGKCRAFIEGYCVIPEGKSLTMENGATFCGEMVFPWKPYDELDAAQREYERGLAQAARILLGEVDA